MLYVISGTLYQLVLSSKIRKIRYLKNWVSSTIKPWFHLYFLSIKFEISVANLVSYLYQLTIRALPSKFLLFTVNATRIMYIIFWNQCARFRCSLGEKRYIDRKIYRCKYKSMIWWNDIIVISVPLSMTLFAHRKSRKRWSIIPKIHGFIHWWTFWKV
jgi:hypothetical protein